MTHDGGNGYWVKNCQSFLFGLRKLFASLIRPEDYFLAGHVHGHFRFENERIASVAQFCLKDKSFTYLLITKENGFKLEFSSIRKDQLAAASKK
jgi:hypothetical protein